MVHEPEERVTGPSTDQPRISRPPPGTDRESELVSRDYLSVIDGPQLLSSWSLGPPPGAKDVATSWEINQKEWRSIQTSILTAPQVGPLNYAPVYLVVCGRGYVEEKATLSLRLSNPHLEGKPYRTTIEIRSSSPTPFRSPAIEFLPDRPVYTNRDSQVFPEYLLEASVTDGRGYLHPGTNVQLWSETP